MAYALVFDFGGVLMKTVDHAPRWAWDDRLGLPRGGVERIVHGSESWRQAQTGAVAVADYWADVARQLGLSAGDVKRLEHDYFSGDVLDTEMVAFLRRRQAAGQRIALLSNDSPALADKLRALGIDDLFDPLIISAQIGVMKPAAEAYRTAIARLGVEAAGTVFVDDMPANIEGARAVGMIGILYRPGMSLETALAPYI